MWKKKTFAMQISPECGMQMCWGSGRDVRDCRFYFTDQLFVNKSSLCSFHNLCLQNFEFRLEQLLSLPVKQSVGRAVEKDPGNSLSVEGFIQKTLVASPEVALIHCSFIGQM